MTIKTQNGKVITKGGKVSCTCCEEPECCMYPAAGLGVDFFNDDLPDAVTVNGVSKSRSGSQFGNTTDGIIWESGVWARYTGGIRATQACLITGDGNFTPGDDTVEDQFEDTYSAEIDLPSDGAATVTIAASRVSQCYWEGESGDYKAVLEYINLESEDGFIFWRLESYRIEDFGFGPISDIYAQGYSLDGSSPVGDYRRLEDGSITGTVSEA